MKSQSETIKTLNQTLKLVLTGINHYFLHARMNDNWGFSQLNKHDYAYSIALMKSSDKLIKRVLFLEGLPNLQDLGRLYIGEDVPEILVGNLKFETELREGLLSAIAHCEQVSDFISRELLEAILTESEDQIDWLESQDYLIEQSGLENYLQSVI